jgi:hypothetical protein
MFFPSVPTTDSADTPHPGDVYNGEWRAGKKDGKGTYKSANGSMYVGQFENGKRHGSGMQRSTVVQASNFKTTIIPYRLVEAEVYNGAWKFGKRCGKGTIHVKDQLVYDGEFMNDQRDGQGTGYLKNGVLPDADRPCALSLVHLLSLDSG